MKTNTTDVSSDADKTRAVIRESYGQIARTGGSCCGSSGCASAPDALARAIGYDEEALRDVPAGANLGLSCGNPTAIAALRPGETVLDLGSGGGFDVFVAGRAVGAAGRAIGVDMTADMLALARRNAATYREQTGLDNVEFRLGEIENLPVADASVDTVISNCVLNLSADKPRVWREIARVLKPGGRVAVSDLALLRPLPESVRTSVEALVGCVAGAAPMEDVRRMATEAGLVDVRLTPKSDYMQAMETGHGPLCADAQAPAEMRIADFVTSLDVQAVKPSA